MSDPVTKLRRRIDLEEFRLRPPSSTDQTDGEPPAESPPIVGGVADEDIRSWRPNVFVVVAIFIAGIAATGLSLVFRSELSGPPATIKAENGPAKLQKETTIGVDVSARDAAVLSKPPGPPSRALVNSTEQPVNLPQAEEKTPPFASLAGSQAPTDNGHPAAATPAQTQTLAEPLSTSAPIEPEKMRTDLQSDGAPVTTVTLPQANVMEVPLPPAGPAAAATAPTLRQIVKKAKAKPAGHSTPRRL
jgi:hypothetical protein